MHFSILSDSHVSAPGNSVLWTGCSLALITTLVLSRYPVCYIHILERCWVATGTPLPPHKMCHPHSPLQPGAMQSLVKRAAQDGRGRLFDFTLALHLTFGAAADSQSLVWSPAK